MYLLFFHLSYQISPTITAAVTSGNHTSQQWKSCPPSQAFLFGQKYEDSHYQCRNHHNHKRNDITMKGKQTIFRNEASDVTANVGTHKSK